MNSINLVQILAKAIVFYFGANALEKVMTPPFSLSLCHTQFSSPPAINK